MPRKPLQRDVLAENAALRAELQRLYHPVLSQGGRLLSYVCYDHTVFPEAEPERFALLSRLFGDCKPPPKC